MPAVMKFVGVHRRAIINIKADSASKQAGQQPAACSHFIRHIKLPAGHIYRRYVIAKRIDILASTALPFTPPMRALPKTNGFTLQAMACIISGISKRPASPHDLNEARRRPGRHAVGRRHDASPRCQYYMSRLLFAVPARRMRGSRFETVNKAITFLLTISSSLDNIVRPLIDADIASVI